MTVDMAIHLGRGLLGARIDQRPENGEATAAGLA
jgi:hypothetical protein